MMPTISILTNKFNTRSVKCWSPFDIDRNQILATTQDVFDQFFSMVFSWQIPKW